MASENNSGFLQQYNMLIGVLLIGLITSILFLILPNSGYFFLADILLLIGSCCGLYFTFKKRKETQLHIRTGVIVGLVGSVLSLTLIGLAYWIFDLIVNGFDFIFMYYWFLYLFLSNGIIYMIVGIIIGYLFGNSFRKKNTPETKYPLYN